MGFFKIVGLVAVPATLMTYSAFSLGKQLPKASRIFGNYIGLSYLYFKSALRVLKPEDQLSYEMLDIARRAKQQSQVLKRQLKTTYKKAKQEFRKREQQAYDSVHNKIVSEKQGQVEAENLTNPKQSTQSSTKRTGTDNVSQQINQIEQIKSQMKQQKKDKMESNRFLHHL